MHKIERSASLDLVALIGIDPDSDGLARARDRGLEAPDNGIEWVRENPGTSTSSSTPRAPTCTYGTRRSSPSLGIARDRPDPCRARAEGDRRGQPGGAPRRAQRQHGHLRRAGDRAHGRGGQPGRARALRRDGLDCRLPVRRPGHPAEHRRVHAHHGAGARGDRRCRDRQGDHRPQPGRAADPHAQHGVLRPARGHRPRRRRRLGASRWPPTSPGTFPGYRLKQPPVIEEGPFHTPGGVGAAPRRRAARGRGSGRLPADLRRKPRHHDRRRRPRRRGQSPPTGGAA